VIWLNFWQHYIVSLLSELCSWQTFLYTWIHNTLRELNISFYYDQRSSTSDLSTIGRNLIYHLILPNALRQTYLCKLFNHTWQEIMYHSNLTNALSSHISANDLTTLSRNVMYLTILTYTLRQTYMWFVHTWQELNISFHSDLCF
jgi:hypothetical protein